MSSEIPYTLFSERLWTLFYLPYHTEGALRRPLNMITIHSSHSNPFFVSQGPKRHNITIEIRQIYFLMVKFFKIEPAFDFDVILERDLQTKCAKVAPLL